MGIGKDPTTGMHRVALAWRQEPQVRLLEDQG